MPTQIIELTETEKIIAKFLIPKGQRLLVLVDKPNRTYGSIIIPENAQLRTTTGIIVNKGEAVEGFEIGQHILYTTFGGSLLRYSSQTEKQKADLMMITVEEVIGVFPDKLPEDVALEAS